MHAAHSHDGSSRDGRHKTASSRLAWEVRPDTLYRKTLPDQVEISGRLLPRIERASFCLVPSGIAELLGAALRQNPTLFSLFREQKIDRIPGDLVVRDQLFHVVDPARGEMIVAPVRSRALELFFRELTLVCESGESFLEPGLAEKLKKRIGEQLVAFLPLYGASPFPLVLTRAELSRAFGMRSHAKETRLYRIHGQMQSEQAQYAGVAALTRLQPTDERAPASVLAGALYAHTPLGILAAPEAHPTDRRIAALSTALQGALYRKLYEHRDVELRTASPIPIPGHVLSYSSPDELWRLCHSGTREDSSQGAFHTSWEWTLSGSPELDVLCEVRFHTKVADSLGDTLPCYVVEFKVRESGKDVGSFTLLDSNLEPAAVAALRDAGTTTELGNGFCVVSAKELEKSRRTSLWYDRELELARKCGNESRVETLLKEQVTTALLRQASHFLRRPEHVAANSGISASVDYEIEQFLNSPPAPSSRDNLKLPGRGTSGICSVTASTLREMFARRPALNHLLYCLHSPPTRLQVLWVKGQFALIYKPASSDNTYVFDVSWGGEFRSQSEMREEARGIEVSARGLDVAIFEEALLECKRALLVDLYRTQLAGHTPLGHPALESGTPPPERASSREAPSTGASEIAQFIAALDTAHQEERLWQLVEPLDNALSNLSPMPPRPKEYVRIDFNYRGGGHQINRVIMLPPTQFIGGPTLTESFEVNSKGEITSTSARLFGRSVSAQLPHPSIESARQYLAHIAETYERMAK